MGLGFLGLGFLGFGFAGLGIWRLGLRVWAGVHKSFFSPRVGLCCWLDVSA